MFFITWLVIPISALLYFTMNMRDSKDNWKNKNKELSKSSIFVIGCANKLEVE